MANCCDSLKMEAPSLARLCEAVVNGKIDSCERLDRRFCYNDFKGGTPKLVCKEKDEDLEPLEFLGAVLEPNLYMEGNRGLLTKLENSGFAPPWLIKDADRLKELYDLKTKAGNINSLVEDLRNYLAKNVAYLFKTGVLASADDVLAKGRGNCVDRAFVFHGMAIFAGLKDSFYIRYANNWALFHILNGVKSGKETVFIDHNDPSAAPKEHKEDLVYETSDAEVYARYKTEEIRGGKDALALKVTKMKEVYAWSPQDFFIPFNIGLTILENSGNEDVARSYFDSAAKLNPYYLPAMICRDNPAGCLEKLK